MNIYVGNLPYDTTEGEMKDIFSKYGEVSTVSVITDRYTSRSKGFGFVEMPDQAQAEEAIKSLDGSSVSGRSIKVNQAKPRDERPPRRDNY